MRSDGRESEYEDASDDDDAVEGGQPDQDAVDAAPAHLRPAQHHRRQQVASQTQEAHTYQKHTWHYQLEEVSEHCFFFLTVIVSDVLSHVLFVRRKGSFVMYSIASSFYSEWAFLFPFFSFFVAWLRFPTHVINALKNKS